MSLTPRSQSARLTAPPTSGWNRSSTCSERSISVTLWLRDSVAAVSQPISPAPTTVTLRGGPASAGSSAPRPDAFVFSWQSSKPDIGGRVERRPVAHTSSSKPRIWGSPPVRGTN